MRLAVVGGKDLAEGGAVSNRPPGNVNLVLFLLLVVSVGVVHPNLGY